MNAPKPPREIRDNCKFFKGIPVPFVAHWQEDRPDFKVLDMDKVALCARYKLCGLCGTQIMGSFVFLGGPKTLEHLHFRDPAMHEKCVKYASKICPFLTGRVVEYADVPEYAKTFSDRYIIDAAERPDKYGLYFAHGYVTLQLRDGSLGFRAEPGGRIEWMTYGEQHETV